MHIAPAPACAGSGHFGSPWSLKEYMIGTMEAPIIVESRNVNQQHPFSLYG
jgi:hypothetical protein